MDRPIIDRAEDLATAGRAVEGRRVLEGGSALGDVDAIYRLAVWHIVGRWIPRDLATALALLRRAAGIGHVDAALMEIALMANGAAGAPDWPGALALLRRAARTDPLAAEQLALVEAMAIDDAGLPSAPPVGRRLAALPDTWLFPAFLTPGECAHIAAVSGDMMEPALVIDPITDRMVVHPIRTSSGAVIGPARETLVIRAINHRLAKASGTHVTQGEPLQVLHYSPGQQFRPHHDVLSPQLAGGNQRVLTMLIYLNDAYRGGATRFVATGLEVRGRPGDMLLFRNVDANGEPDPLAQHAGLPVTQGAKWLATRWVRAAHHDVWKG